MDAELLATLAAALGLLLAGAAALAALPWTDDELDAVSRAVARLVAHRRRRPLGTSRTTLEPGGPS